MRIYLTLLLVVWLAFQAKGQFYVKGQDPSNLRWSQLKDTSSTIIYHDGLDSLAQIFGKYLNHSLRVVPKTLDHKPARFPLVMHGGSILSNGFVSWAPKRMEIVSTPSLDAYPEPWLFHLALHETRHIVQVDKLNAGFFKPFNFLIGEQSVGLALLFVPLWYLEGDAVYTETALSQGGRGRQASFYRHYLTHFAVNEGSKYTFDKWLLGSYKNHIPSYYNLGYQLVGYTNQRFGHEVWGNALTRITKRPFLITPFYQSLKKDTGYSSTKLFKQMVNHFDSLINSIKLKEQINEYKTLVDRNKIKSYTEFQYPFFKNDSTIIAYKTSLEFTPAIVEIDLNTGNEKVLHRTGYLTERVDFHNNTLVWSEYRSHSRWENHNYSEVWGLNLITNQAVKITRNTRYFNPILIDNNNIVVVENTLNGESHITIIDAMGERQGSIRLRNTLELKELCRGDGSSIIARCASPNGMVILSYKNIDSTPDTLLGPVYWDIANITYESNHLYFTMTDNYREQAFSVNILNGKVYKHTNSPYGLSYLSSYNGKLTATLFTENGAVPTQIDPNQNRIPVELAMEIHPFYEVDTTIYNAKTPLSILTEDEYNIEAKNYSKFKNLIKVHSWAPIYYNPSDIIAGNIEMYPGVTLLSQNLLSTLVTSVGYSYYKTHGLHANVEWMGWYPRIMGGVDYGNDYSLIYFGPLSPNKISESARPSLQAKLRVSFPYSISSGYVFSGINLGFWLSHSNTWMWNYDNERYQEGLRGFDPYFSFYAVTRRAHRDLRPQYGVQLYASSISSPLQSKMLGRTSLFKSWLYLPGVFVNHSTLVSLQREHQNTEQYVRPPRYTKIRGYERDLNKSFTSINLDYSFPIVYPDLTINSVAYFKRIIGNFFTDNAQVNKYVSTDRGLVVQKELLHSVGLELTVDINVLRVSYPFSIGYRGGYRLNERDLFHNLIFSFSVSSITGYNPIDHFLQLDL
jgi:hypothetical protein